METSFWAYQPALPPLIETQSMHDAGEDAQLLNLYGPLLWLYRFLMRFALGVEARPAQPDDEDVPRNPVLNRSLRRRYSRAMSPEDTQIMQQRVNVSKMMSRGLTARQYLERKARVSIYGRVRIYGLRYAGSVLLRRARLTCYDHGSWRAPVSAALCGGVWDAQLPPT